MLPNIMGRLKELIDLKLDGNEIADPPSEYLENARKCISYLRQRLRGCEPFYRMKLMVVGYAGRGELVAFFHCFVLLDVVRSQGRVTVWSTFQNETLIFHLAKSI